MKAYCNYLVFAFLFTLATTHAQQRDSLRFPINDRRGDIFSNTSKNPFDLRDTSLIKQKIEYDPKTKSYYVVEKIGNSFYRKPVSISFEEFQRLQAQRAER